MPRDAFSHVTTWVFDLDQTLYPPEARLFDLIEARMVDWVMRAIKVDRAEANHLRQHYWQTYGTTLAGLMREHGVDPGPYLTEVHDIPMDRLTPDPLLAQAIRVLPGRRIVYTNGCAPYAERVLEACGLSGLFDAVYGVEHADFLPKTASAAMFEDDPRNLAAPHALGMRTVHVAPERGEGDHIHYHTQDLCEFLTRVAG